MRHGRRALLAGREIFLGLQHLGALQWRISIASRSIEEATTPSVAKNIAWRSRGMTWVETGSGFRPRAWRRHAPRRADRYWRRCRRRRRWRRWRLPRARRRGACGCGSNLGIGERQLDAEGGRLGMDAVRCGRCVTVSLCSKARRLSASSSGRCRRAGCRWRAPAGR